jgi:hypothetical protein
MEAALVERVRSKASALAAARNQPLRPVATPAEVAAAEAALGVPLPGTYRQVLVAVANGGFGPAEGLLGVPSTRFAADLDAVEAHARHAAATGWPAGLVPAVYLGAEAYYCVECQGPHRRVIEYNPDFWEFQERDLGPARWQARAYPDHRTPACFVVVAASLASLLEEWVAGRHW